MCPICSRWFCSLLLIILCKIFPNIGNKLIRRGVPSFFSIHTVFALVRIVGKILASYIAVIASSGTLFMLVTISSPNSVHLVIVLIYLFALCIHAYHHLFLFVAMPFLFFVFYFPFLSIHRSNTFLPFLLRLVVALFVVGMSICIWFVLLLPDSCPLSVDSFVDGDGVKFCLFCLYEGVG